MDADPRRRSRRAARRRALARRREGRGGGDARGRRDRRADGGSAPEHRRRAAALRAEHARVRARRKPSSPSNRSSCRPSRSTSRVGTRSSSCAVTTTATISRRCARTSREYQPVLIAVDGGADALLEDGFKPDIIIGDFDSLSDTALHCGAELDRTTCTPTDARPARELLTERGLPFHTIRRARDERGRRDAARVRSRRDAHRRGRYARHDGRVPRQGPAGDGVDVPHPSAARAGARRRQGCEPALRRPHPAPRHPAPGCVGARWPWR